MWELGGLVLPLLPHIHKLNVFALHKQASMDNASEAVPSQEGESEEVGRIESRVCLQERAMVSAAGRQASFMGQLSGLIRGASDHYPLPGTLWTRFAHGGKAIHDACTGGLVNEVMWKVWDGQSPNCWC